MKIIIKLIRRIRRRCLQCGKTKGSNVDCFECRETEYWRSLMTHYEEKFEHLLKSIKHGKVNFVECAKQFKEEK